MEKNTKDRLIPIFATIFLTVASGIEALNKVKKFGGWCVNTADKVDELPIPDWMVNVLLIAMIFTVVLVPLLLIYVGMKASYDMIMAAHTADEYKACLDKRKEWVSIKLVYNSLMPIAKKVAKCFRNLANNIRRSVCTITMLFIQNGKTCGLYISAYLQLAMAKTYTCIFKMTRIIYVNMILAWQMFEFKLKHVLHHATIAIPSAGKCQKRFSIVFKDNLKKCRYLTIWYCYLHIACGKIKRSISLAKKYICQTKSQGTAHS